MILNLENYYLDIKEVEKTSITTQDAIHEYYKLLFTSPNKYEIYSLFNTLTMNGYLKNKCVEERDKKIKNVLEGE